jgi:hypothetical protein
LNTWLSLVVVAAVYKQAAVLALVGLELAQVFQ